MRQIAQEKDFYQIIIFAGLIFGYFIWATKIKDFLLPSYLMFVLAIVNCTILISFFYLLFKYFDKSLKLNSFIFTLSYSLIPTLIWFFSNSIFYFILPPPRTTSILGKGFSIFFIAFSISLLIWKLILVYLALRFSSKQSFYRIIFFMLLFFCFFLPYSLLLYQFKIFRIPFV